jgi:sodium-dependent phosphate cotransporter
VSETLDKQFSKISSSSYAALTQCDDYILDPTPCGNDKCYMDADAYYQDHVTDGRLIKAGLLKGAGDGAGGIVGLIISLIMLCGGLYGLCECLQMVLMSKAKKILRYATKLNDYVAMILGVACTIVVQSSSVVTSALTPLCGIGVLPLEKMLPLTLGANIGTTLTAMIASLVSLKFAAVQIALCHLFFNVFGILLLFPVPAMRRIPLGGSRLLGLYASHFKIVPVLFVFIGYVLIPGVSLGIGALFGVSTVGGVVVLLLVLAAVGVFEYAWWVGIPAGEPLCYKILSKEERERHIADDSTEAENPPQAESVNTTV